MNKKIVWVLFSILLLSFVYAHAPEMPGLSESTTDVYTGIEPSPSGINSFLQSVSPQAVVSSLSESYKLGSTVTFKDTLYGDVTALPSKCTGGFYLISELYIGSANSDGYQNGADYIGSSLGSWATKYTQKIALPNFVPKTPIGIVSYFVAGTPTPTTIPFSFTIGSDLINYAKTKNSNTQWSVSRYVACINPWADITYPYSEKKYVNGIPKPITGAKVYNFNIAPSSAPPPVTPPPTSACISGSLRCSPTSTKIAQTCTNGQWKDTFDCNTIQSSCDKTTTPPPPVSIAGLAPNSVLLCRVQQCQPTWYFAPTGKCVNSAQEGSWQQTNCPGMSPADYKKPQANPYCKDEIINVCEIKPESPECKPGGGVNPGLLNNLEIVQLWTKDNRDTFSILQPIEANVKIRNSHPYPVDGNLEIGIYTRAYADKWFSNAQTFSLFPNQLAKQVLSCGQRDLECQANPYCENFNRNFVLKDVPAATGGIPYVNSLSILNPLFGTGKETVQFPQKYLDYIEWKPENYEIPNVQSVLQDKTSNYDPNGKYSIIATMHGGCGSGEAWSSVRKDITITCPAKAPPEGFSQEFTKVIADITGLDPIIGNDKLLYALCHGAKISETCDENQPDGLKGILMTGESFKQCVNTEEQLAIINGLKFTQQSIDAKKLGSLTEDEKGDYLCAPEGDNCPGDSHCSSIKYLEGKRYLTANQGTSTAGAVKLGAAALGGVAGCLGGLYAGAGATIASGIVKTAGATSTVTSTSFKKAVIDIVKTKTPAKTVTTSVPLLGMFNPGTICLASGAAGAAAGYGIATLGVGIEQYLAYVDQGDKNQIGFCVTEGSDIPTNTTPSNELLQWIADAIGISVGALKLLLMVLAGLWVYNQFFRRR